MVYKYAVIMPLKVKDQRKNTSPFCSSRSRKRKISSQRKKFDANKKQVLADSDKGSWFSQEQQWPEQLDDSKACSSATNDAVTSSSSKRKLEESMKSFLENSSATESSSSESPFNSSEDDEDYEECSVFLKPTGNYIVNVDSLGKMLETSAVCKLCYCSLHIVEKVGSKQGLGAKWNFRCTNECCVSRELSQSFPISPKSDKIYNVNRASVVGFRAIGKGRSAAQKCFSFLGLSPVYTWDKHTTLIEEKVKDLTEIDFNQAALQLKQLKRTVGEVGDCTDQELVEKVVDVGASFDGSWSSRGWSARDGLVAAVSEDTGKVLDVVYLTRECKQCKEIEGKRARGELGRLDYLSWYIAHEPNCLLNHEGSAQVPKFYFYYSIHYL